MPVPRDKSALTKDGAIAWKGAKGIPIKGIGKNSESREFQGVFRVFSGCLQGVCRVSPGCFSLRPFRVYPLDPSKSINSLDVVGATTTSATQAACDEVFIIGISTPCAAEMHRCTPWGQRPPMKGVRPYSVGESSRGNRTESL